MTSDNVPMSAKDSSDSAPKQSPGRKGNEDADAMHDATATNKRSHGDDDGHDDVSDSDSDRGEKRRRYGDQAGNDQDTATEPTKPDDGGVIDRTKVCPFLLRVYPKMGRFNRLDEFLNDASPDNELECYTWMSETLRGLTQLVKAQLFEAQGTNKDKEKEEKKNVSASDYNNNSGTIEITPETTFSFQAAYQSSKSRYDSRDIGTVVVGKKGEDDLKTLADAKFVIGDYIIIKISNNSTDKNSSRRDRDRDGPRDHANGTHSNGNSGGHRRQNNNRDRRRNDHDRRW